MLIKNFDELALTDLRKDGLNIVQAGLEAVEAPSVIKNSVQIDGEILTVKGHRFDLSKYEKIYLAGIGKMACGVGEAMIEILGKRIDKGMILGTKGLSFDNLECVIASHPLPTQVNVDATMRLVQQIQESGDNDLIIMIVTGGGSSMMCYPNAMSCDQESLITHKLFEKGATIQELNVVRKHISKVKGGWLAAHAGNTDMLSLIFSDVPGNDLSLVASGPTVFDASTVDDAAEILARYDVIKACNLPECELLETPKDPKIFEKVVNILMIDNLTAVEAMAVKAEELGYEVDKIIEPVEGEARLAGKQLLERLGKGKRAVVAGGETTVKVVGHGRGGRNQELVMGSFEHLKPSQVILSIASDGNDLTGVAGAIGDLGTLERAALKNILPMDYLNNNDSASFFEQVGDSIETGKLDSNVSDLMVCLQG